MSDLNKLPQRAAGCVQANLDSQANAAFVFRFGTATRDAVPLGAVQHPKNTDLQHFPDGLGTYSKGLLQSSYGIPETTSFTQFLKACGVQVRRPVADFENNLITLGGADGLRNGPRGAFARQQVGKDSAAFTVPAPPALDSIQYGIEFLELSNMRSSSSSCPGPRCCETFHFRSMPATRTAEAAADELSAIAAAHPGGRSMQNGKVTPDRVCRSK